MKVILQRAARGKVSIDSQVVGKIEKGFVILVGVRTGDTPENAIALARKTSRLRIFPDEENRMNLSLLDVGGSALVISQFTLYADTRKGNRPSFIQAGDPAIAEQLYNTFISELSDLLTPARVQTGRFGASMQVEILNDGPVTIELNTDEHPSSVNFHDENPPFIEKASQRGKNQ